MTMLTKKQWLAGPKKSGTYARYVAWYKKYVALPSNPLAPWSLAQQRRETNKRVEDILNPLRKEAGHTRDVEVASSAAAARQASAYFGSKIGTAQKIYDTAAQEVAGFGGGYSAAMKARIQGAQDAAAQFASSQGATGTTPGVDATALADTAYAGAEVGATNLASEGAAASAFEGVQAGLPQAQHAQNLHTYNDEYEQKLLEIAQKRPELADQIAQQLFENEMAKLDARIKVQAQNTLSAQFQNTVRHQLETERQGRVRNRTARDRYNLAVTAHQDAIDKAAAEDRYPNASLSRAYGYIVDRFGHPILDSRGKKIPVPKGNSAQDKKAKSNAQYQKAVGEANKMFEQTRPGSDKFGRPTKPERAWRWGNALRRALIAAGFKPPPGSQYANSNSPSGNPGGTAGAAPVYGGRGGQ
jgi:hypothetical protein